MNYSKTVTITLKLLEGEYFREEDLILLHSKIGIKINSGDILINKYTSENVKVPKNVDFGINGNLERIEYSDRTLKITIKLGVVKNLKFSKLYIEER